MFKSVVRPTKGILVTYPVHQASVSIRKSASEVYEFMVQPENMPLWAQGLTKAQMKQSDDGWIAESPMGKVKIRFVPRNNLGVLDHDVTLPSGEVNHNPLRVVRNGEGSEVIFTLYRLPKMSDEDFEKDQRAVHKDLQTLKSILENR
ncbi:SRPBCC family protein [Bdellovibrio sp. HCB288]|uniref:SRPBCC family protein n=1 Tax=Bdellovibrio sp. HCB288 TaxID=3394355 RepID=UPI0039B45A12